VTQLVPTLPDLLQVIRHASAEVRPVVLDRAAGTRYKEVTENLGATLMGLCGGGLGEIFSHATIVPMRRDKPVVFDGSSIDGSEMDLQAAALALGQPRGAVPLRTARRSPGPTGLPPQRCACP